MALGRKFLLTKTSKSNFWRNNYINNYNYSNFTFQLNLLKFLINFFFLNSFSSKFLNKKNKTNTSIYVSRVLINSINNILIISFSLYTKIRRMRRDALTDNYIRLKYLVSIIK